MNKITIGFSSPKKFHIFSTLIKWADNSDFSHVYLRRKSKYGEYVYQASGMAVNFTNIDIFLKNNHIHHEFKIQITGEQQTKLLKFFISKTGTPYGIDQICKIAKILLLEKIGIKKDKTQSINGQKKFICSELGIIILKDVLGMNIDNTEAEDLVTPHRLFSLIKELK